MLMSKNGNGGGLHSPLDSSLHNQKGGGRLG